MKLNGTGRVKTLGINCVFLHEKCLSVATAAAELLQLLTCFLWVDLMSLISQSVAIRCHWPRYSYSLLSQQTSPKHSARPSMMYHPNSGSPVADFAFTASIFMQLRGSFMFISAFSLKHFLTQCPPAVPIPLILSKYIFYSLLWVFAG